MNVKINAALIPLFLIMSCAGAKDKTYIASTPANAVVRSFLGIPLTDSVDFIRWKLTIDNDHYKLHCIYGIGKPNTNGFIGGGKIIGLSGDLKKRNNNYLLQNGTVILKLAELNDNLLHVMDANGNLLAGNGGWSYTLNSVDPTVTDAINITVAHASLKDSMVFEGRTPCGVPGVKSSGEQCYKLKWRIILYAINNQPTAFSIPRFSLVQGRWKKGSWKLVTGTGARITYQLNDSAGNVSLYLIKAGENILLFTDAKGNLLVGDEDFSYTLNRRI